MRSQKELKNYKVLRNRAVLWYSCWTLRICYMSHSAGRKRKFIVWSRKWRNLDSCAGHVMKILHFSRYYFMAIWFHEQGKKKLVLIDTGKGSAKSFSRVVKVSHNMAVTMWNTTASVPYSVCILLPSCTEKFYHSIWRLCAMFSETSWCG